MPYPAGLALVTVTGRVPTATSGQASFNRPYTLVGAADNSMVPPETKYAALDASGNFTIEHPATNDPGWVPVNSPILVEIISSAGIIRGTVLLDYQTATVELADLLQVDGAAVAGTTYIALSSRGVASGVAALDADGDVNNAAGDKITGGGGGGGISATIVNAKGDLIAATANDTVTRLGVGADGRVLTAASGEATGLQWVAPTVYETAGAAADAVSTHAALADPHTGYALEADVTASLDLKAPLASPTFTGTVAGVSKAMVGLGSADNTSDVGKPVSTAQQAALDLKADLASPALTGNPTAPTQTAGNDSTRLATTAFVTAAVAGAGGGSPLVVKRAVVSSGNITPQNTAGAWAALTGGPTLVIPAAVGDYLAVEIMALIITKDAATFYDLAIDNAGLVRFGSSGTGTPASEGDGSLYHDTNFPRAGTTFDFVAEAGDIAGGNVTVCFAVKSAGSGTLHAGFYPLRWRILNHGAATVS